MLASVNGSLLCWSMCCLYIHVYWPLHTIYNLPLNSAHGICTFWKGKKRSSQYAPPTVVCWLLPDCATHWRLLIGMVVLLRWKTLLQVFFWGFIKAAGKPLHTYIIRYSYWKQALGLCLGHAPSSLQSHVWEIQLLMKMAVHSLQNCQHHQSCWVVHQYIIITQVSDLAVTLIYIYIVCLLCTHLLWLTCCSLELVTPCMLCIQWASWGFFLGTGNVDPVGRWNINTTCSQKEGTRKSTLRQIKLHVCQCCTMPHANPLIHLDSTHTVHDKLQGRGSHYGRH